MPSQKRIEQIMKKINEAIIAEEMAVPIYNSHLAAAFSWSGLKPEVQKKIEKGLKTLSRESLGHVRLLKKVHRIHSRLNTQK